VYRENIDIVRVTNSSDTIIENPTLHGPVAWCPGAEPYTDEWIQVGTRVYRGTVI
jgi:hypothetical protein